MQFRRCKLIKKIEEQIGNFSFVTFILSSKIYKTPENIILRDIVLIL